MKIDSLWFSNLWLSPTSNPPPICQPVSNHFSSLEQPFKICILGPPGVGKSTIAAQLAAHYKIHHIHAKEVVSQAIEHLNRQAKRAEADAEKPSGGDDEEQEEEEEEELPDLSELEAINDQLENNNGRLDDALVVKFFKEKLSSKACQNQGFIIDGFPKTRWDFLEYFGGLKDKMVRFLMG